MDAKSLNIASRAVLKPAVRKSTITGDAKPGMSNYFTPLRKSDLHVFHRCFWAIRAEPIFIDIYEPTVFFDLAKFMSFFAVDKRPIWVLGTPAAPLAYFTLHDFQLEHDLANLDFVFFEGYPAPGSELALAFWEFVRQCLADRGLTRVQSFVLPGSKDKISLIESLGFRKEGVLREHYFHNGKLHDVVVHAWMAEGRGV